MAVKSNSPKELAPSWGNFEAECYTLSSIMQNADAAAYAFANLRPSDFRKAQFNRLIFEAAKSLHDRGESVDLVTICQELDRVNKLDEVGGRPKVVEIWDCGFKIDRPQIHADELILERQREELFTSFHVRAEECIQREFTIEEIIAQSEANITEIMADRPQEAPAVTLGKLAQIEIANIATGQLKAPYTFGYYDIDSMLGGILDNELVFIAGRPSNGKTSLMNCMASHACRNNWPVLFFSAETSSMHFARRAICTEARVNSLRWRKGRLTSEDIASLKEAEARVAQWPYHLIDVSRIDIDKLIYRVHVDARKYGIKMVFIDYLQKLSAKGRFENDLAELNYILKRLEDLKKEVGLPIIVGCQINRDFGQSRDKRPKLEHLKGTGKIEEYADIVVAVHRPELYVKAEDRYKKRGLAELIILKGRDGETGLVKLYYAAEYTRFEGMTTNANHEIPTV